jgi:hypothetical protein
MTEIVSIVESETGDIPEGFTAPIVDEHTNQFTDRHVIKIEADDSLDHVGIVQLYRLPHFDEGVYREIVVGRESDEVRLNRGMTGPNL